LGIARLQAGASGNPPAGREGAIRRPGTYGTGAAAQGGRVPTKAAVRRRTVNPGVHTPEHPGQDPAIAAVTAALATRGAAQIAHPGGTLLAHLQRVGALLGQWGARPALRLTGLCHAWYGTDGFPATLGDLASRDELATIIGAGPERLVYLYASCDRRFSYPRLAQRGGLFRDRFTGAAACPPPAMRRDFAELTVANELDIAGVNPRSRATYGAELLELFTSWKGLLSIPAWQAVQANLP